ncbi:MAG TPA: glycosyltransferase [Candidatus Methanoperedens sp.]
MDGSRFYPDAGSREKMRRLLGYGDNDIVIVSMGRLVPRKRMHELIRMIPILSKRYRVELLILGDGPEKKKLLGIARSLRVDEHVKFAGFSQNPRQFLNASDIFALCSVEEAFGMSILEAMACELPVVVKNVNGINDILKVYDVLPQVKDAEGMRNNIEFLIENEGTRSMIGKNSRRYVLSSFAWEDICDRTLDVYRFIEHAADKNFNKYYNMKLARIGRIARRLMRSYEKKNSCDDRC